ncbi:MAG: N-acetylglucosamine kinase [Arachnia sp.]
MSTARRSLICLDAGQSSIRGQLWHHGAMVAEALWPGLDGDRPVVTQLIGPAAQLAQQAPPGGWVLTAGVSGLHPADKVSSLAAPLLPLGVCGVRLAHDSVANYVGVLGSADGTVVACGTGAVTIAVGPRLARVDGWGHLLGDSGSAYWIGRSGLELALRAFDGRAPATALTRVIHDHGQPMDRLYLELQADPDRVRRIASWAPHVTRLAAQDEGCRRIVNQAARLLAESAAAASGRAGLALDPQGEGAWPIGAVGKVFDSEFLYHEFVAHIRSLRPVSEVRRASEAGLRGAQLLPDLPDSSPLRHTIAVWPDAGPE